MQGGSTDLGFLTLVVDELAIVFPAMEWVTLALASYGGALSTLLGCLAWRKDRHRIQLFVSVHHHDDWYGFVVHAVNTGFRSVTLNDAWFEQSDGGGYLNARDEELGLSRRLDEGEQLSLKFAVEDIQPLTTGLVIRDTHRREHRLELTSEATASLIPTSY